MSICLCLALLAGELAIALLSSMHFILSNFLPDDAFYYFKIALNIAASHGSSFDSVTVTNGYHPLWMLILAACYRIFDAAPASEAPIRIALTLCALLNFGSALLIVRLFRTLARDGGAVFLASIFWILNPYVIYETLNGLETSLLVFVILVWITAALKLSSASSRLSFFVMGILSGLLILARLDSFFYAIVLLVWLMAVLRAPLRAALLVAFGTVLAIAPYVYWMLKNFGSILPSSAVSNTLDLHDALARAGLGEYLRVHAFYVIDSASRLYGYLSAGPIILFLIGAALGCMLARKQRWREAFAPQSRFLLVAGAGCLLVLFANAYGRLLVRDWYLVPFEIFAALAVAWAADRIAQEGRKGRVVLAAAGALVVVCFFWSYHTTLADRHAHGGDLILVSSAQWINAHILLDARVGVFDAGIIGYYAQPTIINLDGLVNEGAYQALKNRTLLAYMMSMHIDYLIASQGYIDNYGPRWGGDVQSHLTFITNLGGEGGLNAYRVR